MSKRLLLCWCFWFLQCFFIVSGVAAAECKMNSNQDLYIEFEIDSATLNESVLAVQSSGKGGNKLSKMIWTNNKSNSDATIIESEMRAEEHYLVRLVYEANKNNGQGGKKSGQLYYYLWETSSAKWVLKQDKFLSLNDINSASFTVQGVDVSPECYSGQPPPVNPDVCELFPGPVQTWVGNQNNLFTSELGTKISKTENHNVGFSNAIIDTDYPEPYSPGDNVKALCDGITCALNGSMAKGIDLKWNTSGSTVTVFNEEVRDYKEATPGTYYRTGSTRFGLAVDSGGELFLPEGEYWIDSANVSGALTISGEVILHVWNSISVSNQGRVNTTSDSDNLTVYAYNQNLGCPQPAYYPSGPPAVNRDFVVNINSTGVFNGRIYSMGSVALSGTVALRGAVTACQLEMSESSQIVGNSQCFNPPDNNYQLVVSPRRALGLLCERQAVEFQVLDSSGALASQFNGDIDVTTNLTGSGQAFWYRQSDGGTGTDANQRQRFSVINGKTQLWLKSNVIETIVVRGQLVSDGNPSAEGQYSFVPFKLQIQEQALKVVAGKPEQINVSAMSCDTSAATPAVAQDYSGTRTLQLSTRYTLPDSGGSSVELRDKNGNWQSSSVALNFQEGSADSELRYLDAGQTQLSLVDPNCTKAGGCSISGNGSSLDGMDLGDWTRLEGTQTVWSRPYTFALCNITSSKGQTDFSGTASDGPGFVAAGESFSVRVKPVIWSQDAVMQDQSGDGENDIQTTTSFWCRQPVTPNYYSDLGVTATVQLSIPDKPATPSDTGAVGGVLSGVQEKEFSESSDAQDGLRFRYLSWSEVGSLWLQADADYLGMTVDQGVGQLGRFYPAYFSIKESAVSDAYGNFTYMGQPFSMSARVEAQNTQNQPTQNYGYFADDYKESLQLRAVNAGAAGGDANNLTSRLSERLSYQNWDKAIQTISTDTLALLRVVSSANANVTEPDGPYPVDFGLVVKSRHDCATRGCSDFSAKPLSVYEPDGATPETAAALVGDIHARYGRMRLEDAVGRQGEKINIPVLLEYWNAGQFVTNDDDNDSVFNGQLYFKQGITNPTTNAITASVGDIKVQDGRSTSGDLYATEGISSEQVRFWQKLVADMPAAITGENPVTDSGSGTHAGSESQPWLLYNWRGQGDENPSALVTFGVYRGNDRVIYRGERHMNPSIHIN